MAVLATLSGIAGAGSSILGGIGSFQSGRNQNELARGNANQILFNGYENADAIREVADLQIQVNKGVAGLNAQALVDTANFNVNQILQTSRVNAFFQWFGAEYDVSVTNYNAQISTNNAEVARTNANLAEEQALYNAARIQENNQRVLGEQKAGFAKSGVVIDGSAYEVLYDSAIQASREHLLAVTSGDLLSYSFMIESINHLNDAAFLRSQAKAQRVQGYMESAYTLRKGNMEAEAQLFQGYTQANLVMRQSGLESALLGFSSEQQALKELRDAAGGAASARAQGEAAKSGGLFGAIGSGLDAVSKVFDIF